MRCVRVCGYKDSICCYYQPGMSYEPLQTYLSVGQDIGELLGKK